MKKVWVQIDPEVQKVVPVNLLGQLEEINDELLAVLEHWLPFIESEGDDSRQQPWVEKARAAIAKAHLIAALKELCKSMLSAAPTIPHLEGEDEAVGEFSMFGIAWRDASFVANAPPGTKLYTRPLPIGEIEARAKCEWTYDEDTESYDTSCGNKFIIFEGTPEDNDMKFCAYCGGQLADQKRAAAGEGK